MELLADMHQEAKIPQDILPTQYQYISNSDSFSKCLNMELFILINEIRDNTSTSTLHGIKDNKYKFIIQDKIISNNDKDADNMLTITQHKLELLRRVTLFIEKVVCDEGIGRVLLEIIIIRKSKLQLFV